MTMTRSLLVAALSLAVLAACGADRPADANSAQTPGASSSQEVRACHLIDLAAATAVIGAGTEHPGGDTERDTCIYSNPGVAMLTIQTGDAQLYDRITIPEPHTPAALGDRGRQSVQPSGRIAVQFAKGNYSVTIGVQPIGTNNGRPDYLPLVLSAAQQAAALLP